MLIDHITPPLSIVFSILKIIPHFFKTLWNYWKRPKLKLAVSHIHIEFKNNTNQIEMPNFVAIVLENPKSKDLHIDLDKVNINGQSLAYIIQQNKYFCKTLEATSPEYKLTTSNSLLNLFRENWTVSKLTKIGAYEKLELPFYPQGMDDSLYFKEVKDVNIFQSKKKIVLSVTINSGNFHYAVDRYALLKAIVNNLVHSSNS